MMYFRCIGLVLASAAIAAAGYPAELVRGPLHVVYHESNEQEAQQTLNTLESAAREFYTRLPIGDAPVRVVLAHTYEEFRRYSRSFGDLAVSGLADAPKGLIAVKSSRLRKSGEDLRGTLRHELVHILLYRNSNPDALPRWLNEGIAMILADEYPWAGSLQIAKMFLANRVIEYKDLEYAFLAPGSELEFGDAYAQALSMTKFLREELGEEKFWAVVLGAKGLSFPDAMRKFGQMAPMDFWHAYLRSLWLVALLGALASGSFFTPAAFLLIAAYWRRKRKDRVIINRWEREEADAEKEDPRDKVFFWDDVVEGPYDWEVEDEEEEKP